MVKRLYMETTKIPAKRTAGQISELLGEVGARAVLTEFDDEGKIHALAFQLEVNGRRVPFRLPVRSAAVYEILSKRRRRLRNADALTEQAERVAWRQVLRWLQAQLALVQTGMVEAAEVFLPYLQVGVDDTLYTRLAETGFKSKLIEAPRGETYVEG